MSDWFIRLTTALAVVAMADVAAVISYQHAYELVTSHGETGLTARLLPFTVDGLIGCGGHWGFLLSFVSFAGVTVRQPTRPGHCWRTASTLRLTGAIAVSPPAPPSS